MPRLFRPHWTPRYVFARALLFLRHKLNPREPWLTVKSIRILEKSLPRGGRGIEFGCGRSTVWLAARCGHLTSIEHDEDWHRQVTSMLAARGTTNVDLRLCATGQEYEAAIDDIAELDFGLIDGKRRLATAIKTARRIKPGGILILDNADRFLPERAEEWAPFLEIVCDWRYVPTSNGVWRTDLWFRP